MNKPTFSQVEMTIRCKAFAGQPIKNHRVMVDDANVRVYDPIAGHFTLCHSLSKSTISRIIARAANGEGH